MAPVWLKALYGAFLLVLVPLYWRAYGPANFLWFSDLALLLTFLALVRESRLLFSTMAVAVLLPELAWTLDFLLGLLGGAAPIGLAGYMFDADKPLWLRLLSLFHVPLPVLLIWGVWRAGYDPRALPVQTLLAWVVLPLSYLFSDPAQNVNWVYGPGTAQQVLPQAVYLAGLMLLMPLAIYFPTHLLLRRLFGGPGRGGRRRGHRGLPRVSP